MSFSVGYILLYLLIDYLISTICQQLKYLDVGLHICYE